MNLYWLVVAMLVVALSAILVAAAQTEPAPPSRRPRRTAPVLAVMAASDATGEGLHHPDRDNWVAQLAAHLPPRITIHNLAVGGSTLAEARRAQLPRLLGLDPDAVVCWLVVNDLVGGVALSTHERELSALLTDLGAPSRPVVVGNAPDLAGVPGLAATDEQRRNVGALVSAWNAAIDQLARRAGAVVVDLASEPVATGDLGPDGFHPSQAGHARLAARFLPAVSAALGLPQETPPPAQ